MAPGSQVVTDYLDRAGLSLGDRACLATARLRGATALTDPP